MDFLLNLYFSRAVVMKSILKLKILWFWLYWNKFEIFWQQPAFHWVFWIWFWK